MACTKNNNPKCKHKLFESGSIIGINIKTELELSMALYEFRSFCDLIIEIYFDEDVIGGSCFPISSQGRNGEGKRTKFRPNLKPVDSNGPPDEKETGWERGGEINASMKVDKLWAFNEAPSTAKGQFINDPTNTLLRYRNEATTLLEMGPGL
ncbi:hypothetical protein H6P81_005949 [Aristolochia fimbriata]|uniref:Uncharacterized protein n=1 Tax=Aristolochia fimbriata TaxID=158543 RepID=A0AAV7EVW9_ARIFI|nr:hypothetical protein H6P81_005949 [Aristolochia fimbriata]